MKSTLQFEGLSILQHGYDVADTFDSLFKEKTFALDRESIRKYHIYHDCGKPAVMEIDEEGKRHFPDHARASYEQYLRIFPNEHDIATLILMDMEFHTRRGEEITELWKHPFAPILFFTAYAELIANSKMFGGIDSTSFKIKKKRLMSALKKAPL